MPAPMPRTMTPAGDLLGPAPAGTQPPVGSPDVDASIMAAMDEVGSLQKKAMEGMAPAPNTPYAKRTLELLRDALNAINVQFEGAPPIEWEYVATPERAGSAMGTPDPLPPELFLPLMAVTDAIKAVNEGDFDDYVLDPMEAVDDKSLRHLVNVLNVAAKDKALIEALRKGPASRQAAEAAQAVEPVAPTPESYLR